MIGRQPRREITALFFNDRPYAGHRYHFGELARLQLHLAQGQVFIRAQHHALLLEGLKTLLFDPDRVCPGLHGREAESSGVVGCQSSRVAFKIADQRNRGAGNCGAIRVSGNSADCAGDRLSDSSRAQQHRRQQAKKKP